MTMIKVALCGAHMQGLPLNPQLTALGGELIVATQTKASTHQQCRSTSKRAS